ncbi:hypothetical protein [Endozoicomonas sp. 8E]|uniref:hypothetical protein n=1 Tax=Endozoicomonas sp. 8E TaxID=3035692 RepID=UPI00293942DF|nr:hypothetical protein [Endozoicomonas sp. 8E]WOG29464.1 hypothetical protein P6910_07390 [Endozoicomonas sp. 8E]
MVFTALTKLNNKSINTILLSINLITGNALAITEDQKSILKQLTLQEYEELDREIKEKKLYVQAKFYIDKVMTGVNRRKRNVFFTRKNREIAKKMGVKASNNTTKFGMPYTLLRTFNLVQAMIQYGKSESINQIPIADTDQVTLHKSNTAAGVVEDYVDRLLERAKQTPTTDMGLVNLLYEDRSQQKEGTRIIKTEKNKDFNFQSIYPDNNPCHLIRLASNSDYHPDHQLHLLRNGEFVLTHVNIIRQGNLEDGDKIIYLDKSRLFRPEPTSPTRNSASRAREIYIAVDRLQALLDKRYPNKFIFSINEQNFFQVLLDFVAPYGWWKDAFFRIEFNFDNIGNEGPEVYVKYAPRVANLYGERFCLMQMYKNSERFNPGYSKWWWLNCRRRVRYGSDIFTVEELILNVINHMIADFNIRTEGILSSNNYREPTKDLITEEIIKVNNQAKKASKSVYVETDHNKIKESVNTRLKYGEDPVFDYLFFDDEFDAEFDNTENTESIRTDIFIPVEMHAEAEIVEFDYTSIRDFDDLIYKARRKSGFKIPKNIKPVVYYNNQKLDENNYKRVLDGMRNQNKKYIKKEKMIKKRKKKHNALTMIVKVPDYESRAFENAKASSLTHYIPENPCQQPLDCHKPAYIFEVGEPIKWEIHLVENKKLAKANSMLYQYKLILPLETQKTTERYRGGAQYGSFANVWIPTIRDDMSDVEKKFALMSMYDLSRNKFKIPNNLKKNSVSNLGNNIITKSLLTPQNVFWLPTQANLEFLLQRVQMSLLLSNEDYSIAEENNVFFESLISGNIDESVIKDLGFFVGYLIPSLRYVSRINNPDKVEIIYRIVLNYLIEYCVRTLTSNEFDAGSEIVKKLIEKPEQFSLEDIHKSNKKGIYVALNVLQIADFLFTKIAFNPFHKEAFDLTFYDHEVEGLQLNIKSMRKIVNSQKNLIPLFFSHLLPVARYYSGGLDFESSDFSNKFTLSILEKFASRTTNKNIKASLQVFLKKTGQKSDIFSKEKTEELISLFRKNTPKFLVNAPNEQGSFEQTCCHCGERYQTEKPIRGKGSRKNKNTGKSKETLVRPFHRACMEEHRRIRQQAGQLFKEMEKSYPKKQLYGPDYHYNPVPDGFKLIRSNGDGHSMYSSIAEIFNRHVGSGQAASWNQQTIREIMDYNLRQIFSTIRAHPDKHKLMQELGLLLGVDAGIIPAIIDNYAITDSASFAQSESGRLQQFSDAQLIALLVPTQGVWFPVITQGHNGPYHKIYDLRHWVNFAPNLLAMLLENENYAFPDLSESQRATLLNLLLNENFEHAKLFVPHILIDSYQSSAYLIHYPGSVNLMEHFDTAISIDGPPNIEVGETFEALSTDENNTRMRSDTVSSVSANETDSETPENHDPLLLMIQNSFELIRVNGDGNCMYSSIAEIFNRNGRSGQAGLWDQQTIRQIMDYNLRQIFSTIQDHPDKEKLMQELELLLGIDADVIPAVLDNNVITESASFAQSDLARLQQFGDAQLIALLVPTQGVWFPVITPGHHGCHHEIYDLKRWVSFTPNLLAILLQDKKYAFPDLSDRQRAILLQLLLSQNFDQARLFVSKILTDSHQSSAYLIHSPSSEALLEHFDAAVRIETYRNMEVNSSPTSQNADAFEDTSKNGNNKRMRPDPASSVSANETASETLEERNPLSLMIQARVGALHTTPTNTL